jgi:hypothetical protein
MPRLLFLLIMMLSGSTAHAVTYQCKYPGTTPVDFNLTTFRFYDSGVRGPIQLLGNGGLVPIYPGEENRDGPIFSIGKIEKVLREQPEVIPNVAVYSDSRFRFKTTCVKLH